MPAHTAMAGRSPRTASSLHAGTRLPAPRSPSNWNDSTHGNGGQVDHSTLAQDLVNWLRACTYEVCAPGPDLVWPVIPDNMKHAPGRAGQANCEAKRS